MGFMNNLCRLKTTCLGFIVFILSVELTNIPISSVLAKNNVTYVYDAQGKTQKTSCYTFFGPLHFKTTEIYLDKFYSELSVPSWIVPPYELHIFNGNSNGTQRISSAKIEINGVQILNSNDINRTIAEKLYPISLKRLNSINTTLAGQKNSFISLEVCGVVGDLTPPQLTIDTPVYGSVIKNPTPAISIRYEDITGTLESSASGINIYSLIIILDNRNYSGVFKVDRNGASAVIPDNLSLTEGDHILFAAVKDNAGNRTSKTVKFTCIPDRLPVANRDKYSTNENTSLTIETPGIPGNDRDIQPISINTASVSVDPQTLELNGSVTVKVTNTGTSDVAFPFNIIVFEDINTNGLFESITDRVIGSDLVLRLHSHKEITIDIAVTGKSLFKGNLIYVIVDHTNEIDETNENNNIIHSMSRCVYTPPVGRFHPIVEWEWTGSPQTPEWNRVMSLPVIINLNDDNNDGIIGKNDIPDIVFNCFKSTNFQKEGVLQAISGNGKKELFSISNYNLCPASNPAAADIDKDNKPEIITYGFKSGYICVFAFENNGDFKWSYRIMPENTLSGIDWSIAVADIEGDCEEEVIAGNIVLDANGREKWRGPDQNESKMTSTIADINRNGRMEVISDGTVYDESGNIIWSNSKFECGYSAVGNFDNDEFAEIVMFANGYVYLVEHSGEIIWGPVAIDASVTRQDHGGIPTIADFDGDLEPEIGISGENSYTVLNTDGTVEWKIPTPDQSLNITSTSVFDFEGDGTVEVVCSDGQDLKFYRGSDGDVLFEYKLPSGTGFESLLIIDVDNDQNAEIVAVDDSWDFDGTSGIIVIGDSNQTWINTRKIWNQCVYSLTNVEENGSIPPNPDPSWLVHNTFRYNMLRDALKCSDVTISYVRRIGRKIVIRIGNGGALTIPSGLNVAYYRGNPSNNGRLLGVRRTTRQLNPGQYEDITLLRIPIVKPGQYDIHVIADDNGKGMGKYREINEDNNKIAFWFSVK